MEAHRIAVITAHDKNAYSRWRRAVDRQAKRRRGLTGAALERRVMALAQTNPEYVVVGGA